MGKLNYTIIFILTALSLGAQELPGDLMGSDARAWMKANYYTGEFSPLTYAEARQKMFAYIANENGMIECVYSGLQQAHPEGWEEQYPAPFNTEHVVPQSLFGSNEPMRSDIHILQPCFEDWNSARSAYPFREINDNQTDKWYYLDQSSSSIPTQNIDRYSELLSSTAWEPRESKKGDIARAIMYFFTMYPSYDINSVIDVSELCNWHEQDVVDDFEIQRNTLTEVYQGNLNPYIYRPHWANQAWGCSAVPLENLPPVAEDDGASTVMNGSVLVDVLENDEDVDGTLDASSVAVISGPSHGDADVEPDGSIIYDPEEGYIGADTFVYVVCDNAEPALCDTAEVVISIGVSGIFNLAIRHFNVYPNPSLGDLHMEIDGALEYPVNCTVYNTSGEKAASMQLQHSSEVIRIDLADGAYFLLLRSQDGELVGSARFQILNK